MGKEIRLLIWLGGVSIIIVGLVHIIDAKDSFNDAIYKGWLFYANGLVSMVAAFGILKKKDWAWILGLMIAVGSLGGYIASRTVGLPLIPPEPDAWFEPLGVVAMIAEISFVTVYLVKRLNKT